MKELKNEYISVDCGSEISYGGSQLWSTSANMRQCGCGVIACADLLLYLNAFHPEAGIKLPSKDRVFPLYMDTYCDILKMLSPKFFLLIPHFGINGLSLAAGLNFFLIACGSPLRAHWGVSRGDLFASIGDMLEGDFPVILSVGPNFPIFWGKNSVSLRTAPNGRYMHSTRAHYVVVTGMDENSLQVSSWGRKYYIDKREYQVYVDRYSNGLLSSIVRISTNK